MPKVIGEAGRYATARSVSSFQRLIMTTMLVVCAVGFFEGAILTSLFVRVRLDPVVAIVVEVAGGMAIWRLCQAQSQRIDRYERERQNWRSGAEGERSVARTLDLLPPAFVVFHDFNTTRGNFDHLVVGPTGIFALETKNFRGTIGAGESGELTLDGEPSATPYVRQLTARIMAMREKVVALSGREVFIKGLMVFPKARVAAKFGTTRSVYCLRDGKVCEHIENAKFSQKLTPDEIALFTRAFQGIAGMDAAFRDAA